MKFLADMGVSLSTVRALRERGHDVVHAKEAGLQRASEEDILGKASREGRTVLTFDLDFGDLLAAGHQQMPSVMIFRLRDQRPATVTPRALEVIGQVGQELAQGAVVVVEDVRYRVRRLPIESEGSSPGRP